MIFGASSTAPVVAVSAPNLMTSSINKLIVSFLAILITYTYVQVICKGLEIAFKVEVEVNDVLGWKQLEVVGLGSAAGGGAGEHVEPER